MPPRCRRQPSPGTSPWHRAKSQQLKLIHPPTREKRSSFPSGSATKNNPVKILRLFLPLFALIVLPTSAATLDLSKVTKADIQATVAHLQRNEAALSEKLAATQTDLAASQSATQLVQLAANKLQGERDWWQIDDAAQVQLKEQAEIKERKIADEFHKLLFGCSILLAAVAVLGVLQFIPITVLPPPYRWYLAAGVGVTTFGTSWLVLSHL